MSDRELLREALGYVESAHRDAAGMLREFDAGYENMKVFARKTLVDQVDIHGDLAARITARLSEPEDVVTVPSEVITLIKLTDEYCNALDNEDMDVGGYRPSTEIIGEIGPAVDECMYLLDAAQKG